jgi:predicted nucleotidyltransferase
MPFTRPSKEPDTSRLAHRIGEQLQGVDVHKIILFGSRVWGEPHADSDVDILVVLAGNDVPQDATEKGALYRRVSVPLREVQRDVPVDILVHTEAMHRRFVERDSMFARTIVQHGEVIYENAD